MKRLLVVFSICAFLSIGVIGCQKKSDDSMMKDDDKNGQMMEDNGDNSETATQKATITVEDAE